MDQKNPTLDELDKRILHFVTRGVHSYEELANKLQVTRSTIYRRLTKLETMHIISKRVMALLDYTKLGLSAICIGMNIAYEDMPSAVELLTKQNDIKLVWKTFGANNLIVIMACEKGCEGKAIFDIREKLGKLRIDRFEISIGFSWEKVDLSPY